MIIPCMKSTSFGESGGNLARVDEGSVRVGWPGAPGCTTTGVLGSGSCALIGSDKRPASVTPARNFIGLKWSSMEAFTLPQSGPERLSQKPAANRQKNGFEPTTPSTMVWSA